MENVQKFRCRFCSSCQFESFANLGMSPISNAFRREYEATQPEVFYPLRAVVCRECKLVQLQDTLNSTEHFNEHYAYFSSYSQSWLTHAREYAERMIDERSLGADSTVVEIGSNDGYLLRFFKSAGVPVHGVDPSANVAETAQSEHGINTTVAFFGRQTASDLVQQGLTADLIVANNVLAHVPALNDFMAGFKILLATEGLATFEFPHLLRLIENNQFDTIYHEHYSYFSLFAAEKLLKAHGLKVVDVDELETHGGSLRVHATHRQSGSAPSTRINAILKNEIRAGLDRLDTYSNFEEQIRATKRRLLSLMIDAKGDGASIAAYGAPAKGNTLLNYCGIRRDFIDYTVDRNTHKQGLFLPGTNIPIKAPDEIACTRPDLVLILPWNLRDEIVSSLSHIAEWGGRFIIPIPAPEIVDVR